MKKIIAIGTLCILGVSGVVTYIKKHPDPNNLASLESSWVNKEDREASIERLVTLSCDQRFRSAFKPGTALLPTGVEDSFVEQMDSYQLVRDLAIAYNEKSYSGRYICTYYKDSEKVFMNVAMDASVQEILKK